MSMQQEEDTMSHNTHITISCHEFEYAFNMQLRYNYRLDPALRQRAALARAFGCARVVFNDALRARQDAFEAGLPHITDAALSARLTAAKATPERAWLNEVSSVVLQQALADLNAAYRNFFASLTGKRKGPKVAPPRFRSRKDHRQAIRFTANARFRVLANRKLRLPKIASPQFLRRAEKTLRRRQRDLCRKRNGSANRAKARVKVARAHVRVADARRDFHHQLSTRLIRDNQAVAVEDLQVRALARTRLAKSVHDAGWSAFVNMLEYKSARHGRTLTKIGRFTPTSQTCSACGVKDG